jgi:hypothetical protein
MTLKREYLSGITSTAGAATIYGQRTILGQLYQVKWIDGDLADGVDATLYAVGSIIDQTLTTLTDANSDAIYKPRDLQHSEAGAALTGTAGGDRDLPIIDGQLKLVIADGGDTKTGGCIVYWIE